MPIPTRFRREVTRQRAQAGSYVDGEWQSAYVSDTVEATVRPMRAQELVDEKAAAERDTEGVILYTDPGVFQAGDPRTKKVADRVTVDDVVYEIVRIKRHRSGVLNHDQCVAFMVP
jgi:hypothetical protein